MKKITKKLILAAAVISASTLISSANAGTFFEKMQATGHESMTLGAFNKSMGVAGLGAFSTLRAMHGIATYSGKTLALTNTDGFKMYGSDFTVKVNGAVAHIATPDGHKFLMEDKGATTFSFASTLNGLEKRLG